MRRNRLPIIFYNYIKFLPKFFSGSFIAFLFDNLIYSYLRPLIGITYSAFFAFLVGASTLFVYLQINSVSKLSSKKKAFIILMFIGLGSLIINIIFLNIIEFSLFEIFNFSFKINSFLAGITKILSGGFSFLWSSTLTSKFLYKVK